MTTLRIHILYKIIEGPWGGGNQFLKALREYFKNKGVYSDSPEEADVILFNSHHNLGDVLKVKRKYTDKILIHRVDGPITHIRGQDNEIDKIIFHFNRSFADGTIFQSSWSRQKNSEIELWKSPYETIIMNAPNPTIFNINGQKPFHEHKMRLIATSWSGNIFKGFDIYKYLDEHLDFSKYQMTFVGNSPVEFQNIKLINPVTSEELSRILKNHDIYITASKSDPCSNALIEALHCGLPAVARNDGGHPEIIGGAGKLFDDMPGVITAIENVAQNFEYYQTRIDLPTLDEVGQKYYEFAQNIFDDYLDGHYHPKQAGLISRASLMIKIAEWEAYKGLQNIMKEFRNKKKKVLP